MKRLLAPTFVIILAFLAMGTFVSAQAFQGEVEECGDLRTCGSIDAGGDPEDCGGDCSCDLQSRVNCHLTCYKWEQLDEDTCVDTHFPGDCWCWFQGECWGEGCNPCCNDGGGMAH